MTPVGKTTMADIPGIGIGMTSGIAKTMREVPKEVAPISLAIFSTVKYWRSGFFVKISRRIREVRIKSSDCAFFDTAIVFGLTALGNLITPLVFAEPFDFVATAGFFLARGFAAGAGISNGAEAAWALIWKVRQSSRGSCSCQAFKRLFCIDLVGLTCRPVEKDSLRASPVELRP
jgi:hypothetical protein